MMSAKPDIEILSQCINDENGYYRLRVDSTVHYLIIPSGVFDEDTMCRPYLLIPRLPDFPDSPWTTMTLSRGEDGSLTSTISTDPLPEIQTAWHPQRVDVLSLKRTRRFRSGVHEVQYDGGVAIAKIACFNWDIARVERETWAYSVIAHDQSQHPDESSISPDFLGHLTENSRIMGFLLQKVDGEPACIDDLVNCEALLRRLHSLGLIHGDVNRHNFLVDRASGGITRLIDFEHAEEFDKRSAEAELQSLPAELADETGRGSTITMP
ncbi:hypothetical protein M434DRAFT_402234 [Hypoxylon sp. CO27-5]|nr:hypothetical protein M434DRAFT_402234 [Hypoxylon sp. CO27-5]